MTTADWITVAAAIVAAAAVEKIAAAIDEAVDAVSRDGSPLSDG